jgi:UDP-N-acetylglucosamine--N-acetylmuramyl-(pentapeptide) pyrophosphoryl-undecaprenol N-acetylglucosamine transferase
MAKYSISCGGTGGHVFPGMATGQALQKNGHEVALWLSGKAIEAATRHAWTGQVINIDSAKISFHPLRLPKTILTVIRAFLASVKALRAQKPAALLAMGSYSSLGPVLAARYLKIPVILHEANVIPGKAISFLSRFATAIAITFPETRHYLKHKNIHVTGLPIRKQMEEAANVPTELPSPFTVLTMGGSQGAQHLNEMVPVALGLLREAGIHVEAIHLAGEKSKPSVEETYRKAGVPATVYGFCSDMVSVYRKTSLAISRSGANSCLELALFGIPAILIPLPTSARDHQKANAKAMMDTGAAVMLEQSTLTPAVLAERLRVLATTTGEINRMRAQSKARASTGADQSLADLIVKVGDSR